MATQLDEGVSLVPCAADCCLVRHPLSGTSGVQVMSLPMSVGLTAVDRERLAAALAGTLAALSTEAGAAAQ